MPTPDAWNDPEYRARLAAYAYPNAALPEQPAPGCGEKWNCGFHVHECQVMIRGRTDHLFFCGDEPLWFFW